jgi:protein involved in polysaccharide export with SLBB domain
VYEYTKSDSLTTLVRIAQGTTKRADLDAVQLIRKTESGFQSQVISLADILSGKSADIALFPNDRIQIREKNVQKIGNVTIKGEVRYPGYYAIDIGKTTLKQAFQITGGFTERALINGARIYRRPKSDDQLERVPVAISDAEFEKLILLRTNNLNIEELGNFDFEYNVRRNYVSANFTEIFASDNSRDVLLEDGDVITVPTDRNTIYVFGQVAKPGYIEYKKGLSESDYIRLVGGESSESTGEIKVLKAGTYEWKNPGETTLESGDWIFVPKKVRKTATQRATEWAPILSVLSSIVTLAVLVYQVTR